MTGSVPTAAANYIGVDVSGVTLHATLVSNEGEVIERRESPLERETVAAQITGVVRELRDVGGNVAALGVGIPGLVNRQTDRVLVSTDLPNLVRGNLHTELMEATGLR
ncbi:MAG: ROK family protein, partial [Acidobacteria bacterium]|nr:ROK family protein [Acidobacteriota bacterium]